MTWTYVQKTGELLHNGQHVDRGYSGHGDGLDNPEMQNAMGIGPIPCGSYRIGPPHTPVDHIGPIALSLTPDPANEMFGRSAFFIHGDNAKGDHSASNGCIILGRPTREAINNSADKALVVVAQAP